MRQLLAASLLTVSLTPLCHAMDLAEAYRQALKNDPQWSANTSSYLAEKEKAGQSSGALLPTVALSGSLYKNHFSPETGASLSYNALQYGAQIRQPPAFNRHHAEIAVCGEGRAIGQHKLNVLAGPGAGHFAGPRQRMVGMCDRDEFDRARVPPDQEIVGHLQGA